MSENTKGSARGVAIAQLPVVFWQNEPNRTRYTILFSDQHRGKILAERTQ
jgi:hypothetical protein